MNRTRWSRLEQAAQAVIDEVVAELPPEIREAAAKVPSLFQEWSEHDADLLGIYCEFEPGEISAANGPIILYLAAIEAFCEEEGEGGSGLGLLHRASLPAGIEIWQAVHLAEDVHGPMF